MILCSAEPRIISCLPTHVINLVINDNSLEILYIYIESLMSCHLLLNLLHELANMILCEAL